VNGLRLALSWLTVLPVRGPDAVDRVPAGRAIGLAPVVGVLLGVGATAVMWLVGEAGAADLVAGLVTVGALALGTRGMHVDGLADTADGLGSYGTPERAREVMKSGGVGAFGAAALVFAIGIQAFSFAALATEGRWWDIAVAVAAGRVGVVLVCGMPVQAAPGAGFGALVTATQSRAIRVAWAVIAVAAAGFVVRPYSLLGPLGVAVGLVSAVLLARHCVARFGGLNGDVLGAALEVTVTLTAAICALER
jgi:adenosylcobinamide-GDP ribazoletransferase